MGIIFEEEKNIQNFEKECERIAFHIKEDIENKESFCIPYLESFIPDFMKNSNEFLSDEYIKKNIFAKLAIYLDATIVNDDSLIEDECKMKLSNCMIIIKYNAWFGKDDFQIEISGEIIHN